MKPALSDTSSQTLKTSKASRVKRYSLLTALLSTTLLSGCAATLEDYQAEQPSLDLSTFFNGPLDAYGVVQNRSGKVIRRFRADIVGQWRGNQGILDEVFYFADGEQQHRCWRLTKDGQRYSGTAADVTGSADREIKGNTLNWQYTLQIPIDGTVREIQLDDWLYLIDENNLINRADMRKFGIKVGEITLYIGKRAQDSGSESKPVRPLTEGCQLENA